MEPKNHKRKIELDIIKGGLVFIMLLYHAASVSSYTILHRVTDRIHFIHFAFLVVTGFLCGFHYYASAQMAPGRIQRKILLRALKILIIFIAGNIIFHLLGFGHTRWQHIWGNTNIMTFLHEMFLSLHDDDIAFEILYLIAAFLAIAAIIIRLRYLKWIIGGMILSPILIPGSPILFIAFGCTGMLLGILAQEGRLASVAYWIHKYLWMAPFMLILNLWFAPKPGTWPFGSEGQLFFFLFQASVWFFSFLWIVQRYFNPWFRSQVIMVGRYTLPAYLIQMAGTRILYKILGFYAITDYIYYGLCLLIMVIVMWLMIYTVDHLRKREPLLDIAHHMVFE